MRKQTGFTLVELLVVIAVIAILMTIIAPTLRSVTLRTEMVICKSNLHHLGIGLAAYQAAHDNRFMPFRKWILGNYTDRSGIRNGLIWPYVQDLDFFLCPTFKKVCAPNAVRSYVMQHSFGDYERWYNRNNWGNGYSIDTIVQVKDPSRLGIVTEEATYKVHVGSTWYSRFQVNDAHLVCPDWPNRDTIAQFHYPGPGPLDQQIEGVGNVTFVDGHVEDVHTTQTPYVISQKWY